MIGLLLSDDGLLFCTMIDLPNLIKWFQSESRELPWRNNPTPYSVWISEVMLQQTQVAVVIPYYERWMDRFPTIQALAAASLEDVIKLWEGLGYYSRARHLHEGAKYIIDHFDGKLPEDADSLDKIKGIGEYTKGAILSFAFHQRFPAVDGNVIRVLSRYFMIEDDISKTKTLHQIREIAAQLLPEMEPWVAAEALIELGATVCQRKPNCKSCPLKKTCKSFIHGVAEQLPYKSSKTEMKNLYRAVAVLEFQGSLLVRKVNQGEIMSGLHEFPYFEITKEGIQAVDLLTNVEHRFQLKASVFKTFPEISHSFTRYNVRLFPFHLICNNASPIKEFKWMSIHDLKKVAFPSGHRTIFQNVSQNG